MVCEIEGETRSTPSLVRQCRENKNKLAKGCDAKNAWIVLRKCGVAQRLGNPGPPRGRDKVRQNPAAEPGAGCK